MQRFALENPWIGALERVDPRYFKQLDHMWVGGLTLNR
jgi:hypothetical protein